MQLTPREREVWPLLAAGRTNAEIGRELEIALGTVRVHVAALFTKLGARNRVECAARYWQAKTGYRPQ